MPSLGLGFLLVSWSPPAICRWAVGSSQHIPLWRVDSVQLALDGVNFHPAPTLGQPLHLLRGLVGVAGSWGAWRISQARVEEDLALSGVGEAKAALTLVGSPTAPPVALGFRGRPGADWPEGRGLSVQPAVRSWGPLPWAHHSWLLLLLCSIYLFPFASHPSMPLMPACPPPPVLTLIQSSSPAGPQPPPPLSGQAEPDPRPTRVRRPRPLHPVPCTRAFEPLLPSPRPTSGRSAQFPGCKSPPTAPWHLLGFQLQESLSCGGGCSGWRRLSWPLPLSGGCGGRGAWAMSLEILPSKSWASCGF